MEIGRVEDTSKIKMPTAVWSQMLSPIGAEAVIGSLIRAPSSGASSDLIGERRPSVDDSIANRCCLSFFPPAPPFNVSSNCVSFHPIVFAAHGATVEVFSPWGLGFFSQRFH